MTTHVPFNIDLASHEGIRLAAVLDALGPHWDPIAVYAGEAEAHRMLYAHLDPDQQAAYDLLIADGVLPDTPRSDDMMLDPQAHIGCRAWLPCRYCGDNTALYLLASDVNWIWVQCGNCLHRWWHDTGFGKGRHPDHLDDVA